MIRAPDRRRGQPTRRATGAVLAAALLALGACTAPETRAPHSSPASRPRSEAGLVGRPHGRVLRSACALDARIVRRLARGYYEGRSPDIVSVPAGANYIGSATATTHSGPRGPLQRVPLVLYGPGFVRPLGEVDVAREVTLADLAPTLARLVGFGWPPTAGAPLDEVLVERPAARRPALVVVVVWDGGGWNVLRRWPEAWPHLRSMMARGASVAGVTVGSSPSVTPAVHATIGTGDFPSSHGIVDISLRDGDEIVGSWDGGHPTYLETPTLADLYDRSTGNRAKVAMIAEKGWHLGMIGHGAALDGGDEDIAVMGDTPGGLYTTEGTYSLPDYINSVEGYEEDVRKVDLADGRLDDTWLGHPVLGDPERARISPVFALYQGRLLEALVTEEGLGDDEVPDLLYTNVKQIDLVGHVYNMVSPEVEDAVRYTDDSLGRLRRFLDAEVGRGRWVMAVTADHGQTPAAAVTGGWPIDIEELAADVARRFGVDAGALIPEDRPGATWLNHELLRREGVTLREVASFMLKVTIGDNVPEGETIPSEYGGRADERIFEATFPYAWMPEVARCAPAG